MCCKSKTQNQKPCTIRSHERAPTEVREMWAAAAQAIDPDKSRLKKLAQQKLIAHRKAMRRDTLSQAMQKGKIPIKEAKTHDIK